MLQMFGVSKSKVDFSYVEKTKAEKNKTKDQEKLAKIAAKRRAEENDTTGSHLDQSFIKKNQQEPQIANYFTNAKNTKQQPLPKTKSFIPEQQHSYTDKMLSKRFSEPRAASKDQTLENAAVKDKARLAKIMAVRRAACEEDTSRHERQNVHEAEGDDDGVSMQEPLAYKLKRDFRSPPAAPPQSFLPHQSVGNKARSLPRPLTPNKKESSLRPVTPNRKEPVRSVPKSSDKDREKLSQILSYRRAVADGDQQPQTTDTDSEDQREPSAYKSKKSSAVAWTQRQQKDENTAVGGTNSRRPSFSESAAGGSSSRRPSFSEAVTVKRVDQSEEKSPAAASMSERASVFGLEKSKGSLFGPEMLRPRGPPKQSPPAIEKYSSLSYKVAPGDKEKLATILAARQKLIEDHEAKSFSHAPHHEQHQECGAPPLPRPSSRNFDSFSWDVEKVETVVRASRKVDLVPIERADDLSTDEETASASGSEECTSQAVAFHPTVSGCGTENFEENLVTQCSNQEPVYSVSVSDIDHARSVLGSLKEARLQLESSNGASLVEKAVEKPVRGAPKTPKARSSPQSHSRPSPSPSPPCEQQHVTASPSPPQSPSATAEENSKAAQRARALADALCKLSKLRHSRNSPEKEVDGKDGEAVDVLAVTGPAKTVAVTPAVANEKAAKYAKLVADAKERVLQNRRARAGQESMGGTSARRVDQPSTEPLETVSDQRPKKSSVVIGGKQQVVAARGQAASHQEHYSQYSSSSSDQSDEITACPVESQPRLYGSSSSGSGPTVDAHSSKQVNAVSFEASDESMHVTQDSHRKHVSAEYEKVDKNLDRWERLKLKRSVRDSEGSSSRRLSQEQSSSRFEAASEHEEWAESTTDAPKFKEKLGFWQGLFACGSSDSR